MKSIIGRFQTRGDTKMRLLFGTGNQAKLSVMRSRLEKIGIELIGLNDLRAEGKIIPEVVEDGNTPLENARLKAVVYYETFQMPVFSCDSGLYFDNVPDEVQPGVHVRNVEGKCLSDEEMMKHYAGLAIKYGNLIAQYRNAICLVMDEEHIYESMDPTMYSEKFVLTDKPHSAIRKKGFPLDCISIDMKTNKYYYDLTADELEQFAVEDGFLRFFEKVLWIHKDGDDDLYELIDYVKKNGQSEVTQKKANSRALGVKPFSTATEEAFLANLTHALENIWLTQSRYSIQKEVAISQVFQDNITYSDLFYSGRFDFVVYEKQGKQDIPVLAIELDGKEHFEDEVVKRRDAKKNEICRAHHLQIIRVENSYARRYNYIKEILMSYFSVRH